MPRIFSLFIFIAGFYSSLFCQQHPKHQEFMEVLDELKEVQESDGKKALQLLDKALAFEKSTSDSLRIILYEEAAILYDAQGVFDLALNYYNSQYLLEKQLNTPNQFITLKNIGTIYYRIGGSNEKAEKYWREALTGYKKNNLPRAYVIYNNLAILEEKKGNLEEAKIIYHAALESSLETNDVKGEIMSNINLGIVNFNLNNPDKTLEHFYHAKSLAQNTNEHYYLMQTFYNLGYVHAKFGKTPDSSLYYLTNAFVSSKEANYSVIQKKTLEELITLYEQNQDYEQLNYYLKELNSILSEEQEKILKTRVNQIEFKYAQELRDKNLQAQQEKRNWIYFFGIAVLILCLIILFLILKLQRNKLYISKQKNIHLEENLKKRNKELTKRNIEILHATEVLKETQKELKDLSDKPELKYKIIPILNNLKSNRQDFNWQEFDKIFSDINSDFYKKLSSHAASLSRNDLRLSAFLKLNLSTKEIAAITGQSVNSINIARHRLRKKLNLDKDQTLVGFIHKL